MSTAADKRTQYVPLHNGRRVLDKADPLPTAREYVTEYHVNHGSPSLVYHRDALYRWSTSHYVEADMAMLRAELYGMLEDALVIKMVPNGDGGQKKTYTPYKPKKSDVDRILDAVQAIVAQDQTLSPPCWLEDVEDDPLEFVAANNGLLHLPTQTILPPDPRYFALSGLGVPYLERSLETPHFSAFLRDLFGDDADAIERLQELFGYLLAVDTRFQKVFLIVGPKRSGKGTLARILTALLGRRNVAGPTLNSLGQNFGLQSLIGKPLAIISDARLSGRADQAAIAERLLSISGEDSLSIPRKHQGDWIGSLPTRFLILTNELPRLEDASGALASRFIVWNLNRSFYGHEDHDLTAKLMDELPAILQWALVGYRRLYKRGRFLQPESGREAIEELETLGSPVGAFIRDRCTIEPGAEERCEVIYQAWRSWCDAEGRERPGPAAAFGRNLRAAVAGLNTVQRRDAYEGHRYRAFLGIRLATYEDADL